MIIAIVGLGLIGASFAKALRQVGGQPMVAPTVLGAVYTTVTSVSQSPVTAYLPLPAGIK